MKKTLLTLLLFLWLGIGQSYAIDNWTYTDSNWNYAVINGNTFEYYDTSNTLLYNYTTTYNFSEAVSIMYSHGNQSDSSSYWPVILKSDSTVYWRINQVLWRNMSQLCKINWFSVNSYNWRFYCSSSNFTYGIPHPWNWKFWAQWLEAYVVENKDVTNTFILNIELANSIPNIPDDAVCEDINTENYIFNRFQITDWKDFTENEEGFYLQDWEHTLLMDNFKSYSWSISNTFNSSWNLDLTKSFWDFNNQEYYFQYSWTGVTYFNLDIVGKGGFAPAGVSWAYGAYTPPIYQETYENFYKVYSCWWDKLINPDLQNDSLTLWEWIHHFKAWEKYSLTKNYSCLKFQIPNKILSIDIWNRIQDWFILKNYCKLWEEQWLDWEPYVWEIQSIWNWGKEVDKKISWRLFWWDIKSLDWNIEYDKDGDGKIVVDEWIWAAFWWFQTFLDEISKVATSIKNFFSAFSEFWNVEKKDLFGWLIPSTYAADTQVEPSRLVKIFWESTERFKNWDSPFVKILTFIKWLLITVAFMYIIYSYKSSSHD